VITTGADKHSLRWTFSNLIPQPLLKDHDYYDVSTGKELRNHTFAIRYGDGSYAYGKVYTDKVTVGGLTVPSQAIGAARSVSTTFLRDKQNDGMFGLGFSSGNTVKPTKQMTFFDNIKGELLEPLFAVALKHHAVGSYDFGYIDKSKYVGDITYADVNNTRGFWEFSVEGYQVGPRTDKRPVYRPFSAIGDTGTTLIYLPTDVCKAYYEHVPGAALVPSEGGWVFPCSAVLPDISFSIGLDFNMKQTVPGHYLKYAPVSSGSSQCFGGIQAVPLSLGFGIIGDTFLKSKYVIHEFRDDRPRLGFAQQTGV
jgi:aspergillopepsin I